MNQQQIVNRINQLTLGNRLTWFDIMYDADKAIDRINSFLGAKYPKMSVILKSPEHTYSIYMNNKYIPIFPERYIHSIVIPYIAMEVLARDEEFTTIYNKYATEVEDGLFTMFQNEFNNVPHNFRQSKATGVFFGNEQRERKITDDMNDKATVFKFNVTYHVANDDIAPHIPIYVETQQVGYGEDYEVKNYNPQYYVYNSLITNSDKVYMVSHDGTHYYEFLGWRTSKENDIEIIEPYAIINNVTRDIHLYAQWQQRDVLSVINGVVSIDSAIPSVVKELVTVLHIPTFYNGLLVNTLVMDFCGDTDAILTNLSEVYIPGTITTIGDRAFRLFSGHTIEFAYSKMLVTINAGAFNFTNPNCTVGELIIPTNVNSIIHGDSLVGPTFNCTEDKELTVYFRCLEFNIPEDYGDVTDEYFAGECVKKVWGYNG